MEKDKINCEVLIIGGSAGSLDVLMQILPKLDIISTFAIVIVLHRKSSEDMLLEDLISIKTDIPLKDVEDKVALKPGFIYIAPSDYHLLFEKNDVLSLDTSEKINYSRPSIDVAFESAAEIYGTSLIGILLSGANSDGTAGLKAIRNSGGTVVVQNPASAQMDYMPKNAILNMTPDYILDIEELLEFINDINA